ncbi:MAG: S26 family signal peptidase [Treponema sp.]|jgi:signal peptidase I|nr:S26 family signal peptidase [Treponema sp.]
MPATSDFFGRVQRLTEAFLTGRKRRKRILKEKQRKKNIIVDWVEAFLWAAGVVLLVNQYLFQAYQIPSGSMIDTLLIGDHIFVNKIIYGPELLPGLGKLPSPVRPARNDVIIFENPDYVSRGPVFDIAQRVIYMLTLSLVDIDRDESGQPKPHFLIKRAAGMGGDRFVTEKGNMLVRFAGADQWITEGEYKTARNWNHTLSRLVSEGEYPAIEASGRAAAYADMGLPPPPGLPDAASGRARYSDTFAAGMARLETLRSLAPGDERYRRLLARERMGWYVPGGRVFPLGDNRDNSRDGRFFGPVREAKVLGRGAVIYWPLRRAGVIR